MSILEKLKKITHREPEIRTFCIQTIRFRKFLENARSLLDLFGDGREKAAGEYIFDRHYVVSLIDGVIERLGMMVYDACVLAPKSGEQLYAGYDRLKLAAAGLTGSGGAVRDAAGASDLPEPEYRLLSDALRWFNGKDLPDTETVMGFMKQVFFHAIRSNAVWGLEPAEAARNRTLFETSGVKTADMDFYLIDLWKDALVLPEKKRVVGDFNSIPLRHLLMDAAGKNAKGREAISRNGADWVAVVTEHQLSLNALKPDLEFRLETLVSGDAQSDFIFIFAGPAIILKDLIPEEFHIETTGYGQLAWNLDISETAIEDSLMTIGRRLFNESVWRIQ